MITALVLLHPMKWLREVAPIKAKLTVAFGISALLTGISLVLGWWAFEHNQAILGPVRVQEIKPVHDLLAGIRCVLMAAAIAAAYLFGRIIAVPYSTVVERMEGLARGDLDTPIPYVSYRDCVGRIAKAISTFRDNALAEKRTAELNRCQAIELRAANAKLEQLAEDLSRSVEAAEHASRSKSRFVAGMSHELRTPLNGLLGYARLLRLDGPLNSVQEKRVDAMLAAGAHLLDMVNRVLDLSEIESDRVELKPVRVEMLATAQACLDIVRPAAVIKGLALSLVVQPDTPSHVTTDATRLRQVLLNLLGNAVKFTQAGSVEIRLAPGRFATAGVRVEVADTGPGIADRERVHLFQEFERLEAAVMGPVEGAGLGLALSLRLTQLLGGQIGHEHHFGGGSIFWLELPSLETAANVAEDAADEGAAAPMRRALRVLVVDDIAMNREIAGAFLETAGHTVVCAEGGAEAVAAVAASLYDVVVMDIRMPEMDGLEATRLIRALPLPKGAVPIVAMTAHAFADQVVECRQAGMNGHVTKPFTPDALTEAVAKAAAARPGACGSFDGAALPDGAVDGTQVAERPSVAMLPAFDPVVFARTANLLAPEVLVTSLKTIVARADIFLKQARRGGNGAGDGDASTLAEMAHTLGGSAGMFGFGQLAFVSKRFEYAVQRNASDCRSRAAELVVSVEQARAEILARLAAIEAKAARKAALDPGGAETLGADIMRPVRHRGIVNTT